MRIGFAVSRKGVIYELEVSHEVSLAYDILTADGMAPRYAADLATAAERGGKDPVALAQHVVKLRRGLRQDSSAG